MGQVRLVLGDLPEAIVGPPEGLYRLGYLQDSLPMTAMERIAELEKRVSELERSLVKDAWPPITFNPNREDIWMQYDYVVNDRPFVESDVS